MSFLDAQIGRVLDLFDELNLWESTAIILTSDHGKRSLLLVLSMAKES